MEWYADVFLIDGIDEELQERQEDGERISGTLTIDWGKREAKFVPDMPDEDCYVTKDEQKIHTGQPTSMLMPVVDALNVDGNTIRVYGSGMRWTFLRNNG